MSIYRHLDVGIPNSRRRPADILYNNIQYKNTNIKYIFKTFFKMEKETPPPPNISYNYDDEITRMMQEREGPWNDNA